MLERNKNERGVFEIVDTDSLVPAEHLLRKIDAAVDFDKIYDMVEPLYCADNGRPSVDPVVLFKMVLIQHLYGLGSLRRTAEKAKKKTLTVSTTDPDYRVVKKFPDIHLVCFSDIRKEPQFCQMQNWGLSTI